MVLHQLEKRGITDSRVLEAFLQVPRHAFVPPKFQEAAYADHPLPIGEGQTISQPYMVALMTQLLRLTGKERVLEVGTGSGYQAAVLSCLAREVYSIERVDSLAREARERLSGLGYGNVQITVGDGTCGWPEHAPYAGILVTAGAPALPEPLIEQLAEGGRLVVPVGGSFSQELTVVMKADGELRIWNEGGCVFVPLIGEHGWRK
jgi:protein-L-isoaspartate(D-aspartate) O-methyltransferase